MSTSRPILRPGRTCWRIERADQAACIDEAADYYRAARDAIKQARRSIMVLGWDFDPRVRLVRDGADLANGETIRELFERQLGERPELKIQVLRWDTSRVLSGDQASKSEMLRDDQLSDRLQYRLAASQPGTSLHVKLLVIDDAVAFCGGIDFAAERWDTQDHAERDLRRRSPEGHFYRPRHDLMLAVSGPAAAALGQFAREQWEIATGVRLQPPPRGEIWPESVDTEFAGVEVGIARTRPATAHQPEIREIERLFLDSIAAAREVIYVENQYLTAGKLSTLYQRGSLSGTARKSSSSIP